MAEPFLHLSPTDRADALEVAAVELGRPAGLLEKDVWVVWEGRRLLAEDYETMSGSGLLPDGAPSFDEMMADCAEIEARANISQG